VINRDSNYPSGNINEEPKLVAVIDIGSSSLRMQIAEIRHDGSIRNIESFAQALSLGKDSFSSKGRIERSTIEDCVHVLSVYRAKLDEYGITDPENIRVIATSGVNEARNSLAFKDRIFIATEFVIEAFDEAILHRVTYLGLQPYMRNEPKLFEDQSVVIEVGGGTTEVLLLDGKDVSFAKTYRLGALRLRKRLEVYDAPLIKSRELMESQINRFLGQFLTCGMKVQPQHLISKGGDVRFAVQLLKQKNLGEDLMSVNLKDLSDLTDEVLKRSPESLVTQYHLSLPDAQTLGPSLLTHVIFAKGLGLKNIIVANVNLRDGLINEMTEQHQWTNSIQEQIVRSATLLGRKYNFPENHALHVAELACQLFDQLQVLHQLSPRYRGLLQVASIVHEVGLFIGSRSRHKHSMYVIGNSEFFGIGAKDLQLVALLARYYRGATPQPAHAGYSSLGRRERVAVSKMAALLRVAKALDVTRTQHFDGVACRIELNRIGIHIEDSVDLSLEQLELKQAGALFEDIFGRPLLLTSNRDEL
jgi:exopolyphosphatase/guanosine-5'-triphosphate,3'-diphosphate pyrophosphatase